MYIYSSRTPIPNGLAARRYREGTKAKNWTEMSPPAPLKRKAEPELVQNPIAYVTVILMRRFEMI